MKLSIIIVHYNVAHLLRNCLHSIRKYCTGLEYEVIVFDNSSPYDSWKELIQEFPEMNFLASPENLGFSKANNKAADGAEGEYILILNPDTELEGFYMKDLLYFSDQQYKFGCLGVRMHDAKGNFLPESKRAVPDMRNTFNKLFSSISFSKKHSYYREDLDEYEVAEVEIVTGAFLLIKRNVYHEIGGFDERYFMYGEDIDLCYTLLQKGCINYYYGKASLLHYKGESTVKDEIYLERFYGAMQIFIDKYYRSRKPVQYIFLKAGLKLRHRLAKLSLK